MPIKTVVYVVIQKLSDLVKERSEIFENNEVKIVTEELGGMQSILNNAQHQEQSSNLLSKSMVRFLGILYSVEDAIESFVLTETRLKRLGFFKKHIFFMAKEFKLFRQVLDAVDYYENERRLKFEIKRLSKEIQRLKALQGSYVTRRRRHEPWQESDDYDSQSSDEDSIFEKDMDNLLKQITSYSKPLQIISVFGENIGIGTIYNEPEVTNKFACRALLVVDANWSLRDLILSILQQMTSSKDHVHLNDEDLIGTLYGFLKGKKYLIVIKDITSLNLLYMLKGALPDAYTGSRVVITTPDEEAASFADPQNRYHFKSLDMDGGFTIFIEKVWGVKGIIPFSEENMEDLKRKIAKICRGDILKIALLAGLLSTREVIYEDWLIVLGEVDLATKSPPFDFLDFCYNDLPVYLKPCFLYLGLFEKEYEIPVRRLSRLWLAEGFLKSSEEGIIPEDTAEGYLEELAKRNMVEISKRTSDESGPKKCRMTQSLHDIFRPMAVKVGLFHLQRKFSDAARKHRLRVSRVVEWNNIKAYPTEKASNQYLQSYISFNTRKKYMHAEEVGKFLESLIGDRGFGLLKVLDLEDVDRPQLPENLGNLFHLRYLGLRGTFLKTLPSSLGGLLHLETLDIKHTQITTLPSSIWNMKHLRHLCLNGAHHNIPVQLNIHKAPSQLQTLWGLLIDEKIARTIDSALIKMTNLRKLELTIEPSSALITTTSTTTNITTNKYSSSSYKETGFHIPSLFSLRSLRLRSKDHTGQPSELNIIKPFSRLENLSQLYLLGKLLKPLDWYQIPTGLKVLTLSVSQLDKDPMPTLSKLPSLIDLRLLAASYEGKGMCSPANGFPALQVLKLWKLEHLETLTVNEGAMQKLHTLEIRCCEKLKELPEILLQRETFRKLILTNMPKTLEKEMVWRAKGHFDIKVEHLVN